MKKFLSMLLAFLMILAPMTVRAEESSFHNSLIDPEEVTGVQVAVSCYVFHEASLVNAEYFYSGYYPTDNWGGYDNAMKEALAEETMTEALAWIEENGQMIGIYDSCYNDYLISDPNTGESTYLIHQVVIIASDGQSECYPAICTGLQTTRTIKVRDSKGNSTLLEYYESDVAAVEDAGHWFSAVEANRTPAYNTWMDENIDFSEDLSETEKKYTYIDDDSEDVIFINNDGICIRSYVVFVALKDEEPAEDTPSAPSYGVVEDEDSTTTVNTLTYTEGSEEGLTVIVKDVNAEEDILTKDDLDSVYVDGKLVDPSNYDVETGCVIVTLHKDFLDTLGKGDHTVTINLKDGGKSTAGFSVKAAETTEEGTVPEDGKKPEENTTPEDGQTEPVVPQPETTVPKSDSTGSTNTMMVMAIVLALGCAVTLAASKKRENA